MTGLEENAMNAIIKIADELEKLNKQIKGLTSQVRDEDPAIRVKGV